MNIGSVFLVCLLSVSTTLAYWSHNYDPVDSCGTPLELERQFKHRHWAPACSGLTVHTPTGHLMMVHDRYHMTFIMDPATGELLDTVKFKEVHDVECLAYDPIKDRLLVCQEGKRILHSFTWKQIANHGGKELVASEKIKIDTKMVIDGKTQGTAYNGGLEGLTVNSHNGHIYAVNERGPVIFVETDGQGKLVNKYLFNFTNDGSGLQFDPRDGSVWLVSDASWQLINFNPTTGELLGSWNSNFANEGLAIDFSDVEKPVMYMGFDRGHNQYDIHQYKLPEKQCKTCTVPGHRGTLGSHRVDHPEKASLPLTRCDYDCWHTYQNQVKDAVKHHYSVPQAKHSGCAQEALVDIEDYEDYDDTTEEDIKD